MTTEDVHRIRARDAIKAARRGHLPKPSPSCSSVTSTPASELDAFSKAQENSIEVYDDKFGRNSILTRSARMRKFKFYQYKPVYDSPNGNIPKLDSIGDQESEQPEKNPWISNSPSTPTKSILLPREDVLQGKLVLATENSKELNDLDTQIAELESQIADLNRNGTNDEGSIDKIFELVNRKNDLLRRQMQLNILDKERALEKANDELVKELRLLMSIDDSRKTKAQLERQQYLYDQSVALVNRRNELVHHMDVQEKGIEDDEAMKANLQRVISNSSRKSANNYSQADQNCCIQ